METSTLRLAMRLAVPVAACLLYSPVWAAAGADESVASNDTQPAVWTQKELVFDYQGFTTKYSCDGLRDKVRTALLQLGARKKDLQVYESGCASSYGRPDPFPRVRIKISVLVPADSGSDDQGSVVQAHWKPVDLNLSDLGHTTSSGECELLEQMQRKIVPLFATRNVELRVNCIPHQVSPGGASLKLDVLAPPARDPGSKSPE